MREFKDSLSGLNRDDEDDDADVSPRPLHRAE
jgi:hypothetical protein